MLPEQEGLKDEGHYNCHDNHCEDVEDHEERAAPLGAGDDGIAVHNDEPVVDDGELEQGHPRDGQAAKVVEPVQPVVSSTRFVFVKLFHRSVSEMGKISKYIVSM